MRCISVKYYLSDQQGEHLSRACSCMLCSWCRNMLVTGHHSPQPFKRQVRAFSDMTWDHSYFILTFLKFHEGASMPANMQTNLWLSCSASNIKASCCNPCGKCSNNPIRDFCTRRKMPILQPKQQRQFYFNTCLGPFWFLP